MRMRSRAVAIASATAVVVAVWSLSVPAVADRIGQDHLPNLKTRGVKGIRITEVDGSTLLRFTNTVANLGAGPLELRPENVGETTTAYQRVFTHDAALEWELKYEREVGTFVFHPQHNHWHLESFAEYQIREVAPGGGVGEVLREAEDKVSFCVTDTLAVQTNLAHASQTAFYPTACSQNAIQGLSVGWADRYDWRLYGQWVDISGLPDGTYWLTSRADPLDLIDETREADNVRAVKITIAGDAVARA